MLVVNSLDLPAVLPTAEAIRSCDQNLNSYDPEFWEFQYSTYRYLGRVDDAALIERYDGIVRNMNAIVSADRHVIPLNTFLSSWYWYRKEHQTRYEFALRKLSFDRTLPTPGTQDLSGAPARPKSPNRGDIVFRFGSAWLDEFVRTGETRIRAATDYAGMDGDLARQDDERVKSSHMPGAYTTVTTMDGRSQPIIGDLTRSVSGPDYYVLCASADWDPRLFDDFRADRCVLIRDRDEFARRFESAANAQLPGWLVHDCPVEYFDPYERIRHQRILNSTSKDFRFAYQKEWRFLCASMTGKRANGTSRCSLVRSQTSPKCTPDERDSGVSPPYIAKVWNRGGEVVSGVAQFGGSLSIPRLASPIYSRGHDTLDFTGNVPSPLRGEGGAERRMRGECLSASAR